MKLFGPISDSAELIEMSAMYPSAKVSATRGFLARMVLYNSVFRVHTLFPNIVESLGQYISDSVL